MIEQLFYMNTEIHLWWLLRGFHGMRAWIFRTHIKVIIHLDIKDNGYSFTWFGSYWSQGVGYPWCLLQILTAFISPTTVVHVLLYHCEHKFRAWHVSFHMVHLNKHGIDHCLYTLDKYLQQFTYQIWQVCKYSTHLLLTNWWGLSEELLCYIPDAALR